MTRRRSERELERAVEDLHDGNGDGSDTPRTIRTIRQRVDQDGAVVDESEEVVEYQHSGPDLTIRRTVVETEWEPDS